MVSNDNEFSIVKYTEEYKSSWDEFLFNARNSHFFFSRNYMEYHKARFEDFSLLVFDKAQKLIAILPANINNKIVHSHQGLTFGGFVVSDKVKMGTMLGIFQTLIMFLRANNTNKLIYKCIPYIYHNQPAEDDRYALFRNNAKLIRRDVTSTIDLTQQVRYSKGRKWTINKARKENIEILESKDYDTFWEILTKVLRSNHDVNPVHSLAEIIKLMNDFPENIKLYVAKKDRTVVAGAVIFENNNIVHTQYLANSERGKEIGALDLLLDYLIKHTYKNKRYFDFGISNEDEGNFLNRGLISQKEGFGARSVVHDLYEIDLI